jgi:hypothetical protein
MNYILIGLSVFFTSIGFLVTEKNVKYLMAGYNTMSDEQRKNVDIRSLIKFSRQFHVFLGISFLLIGGGLTYLAGQSATGIFMAIYPILAYIYFIPGLAKFYKGQKNNWNKAAIIILVCTLVFIAGLFIVNMKEDKLLIVFDGIEIQGVYGEVIPFPEILSVELVNQLPQITMRSNGFALGLIYKGYFKTSNGEVIKLILNSDKKPYIMITMKNNRRIYFSSGTGINEEIYTQLQNIWRSLE